MPDQLDLVRELYRALNSADVEALGRLYDEGCIAEHVFAGSDDVVVGRDAVCARWSAELAALAGALPGGHRIDVDRIAGIETGWGWVRAEWRMAVRPTAGGEPQAFAGHSHFWVDQGRIHRHRSAMRAVLVGDLTRPVAAAGSRDYPARPIVGVGAVVLSADGQVVLVKRRHEPLAGQWSLPGGTLEVGETLEAGAAREIREETNLIVEVGEVVEVFDRILLDDDGGVRYHFVLVDYLCRPRPGSPPLVAGSDVTEAVWADPDRLGTFRLAEKAADVIALALRRQRSRAD